ncbi:hypothetical protein [Arcticibacterium luteifluviistationis]|uniref:Uncharacterized protein n=1 Tax=Arcticibacterium luteifluviistationis TaxID=1784714 RepID=A0A2Z4G8P7_9BACT|nr:hypothetical protein [Arcticibacterium luteifluviistationis]AWV97609.1 hypothetical protein DJ013_05295 [Arcticibacterium luteifluviistationis]
MERKLDSDIEEIRNVLLSGASQVTWNKQDVWAKIEQKETKKRVWPFALAASVALISFFIFWKVMPTETSEMASVTLPVIKNEVADLNATSMAVVPEKKETIAKSPQVRPQSQSLVVPVIESKRTKEIRPTEVKALTAVEFSSIRTEIDFKDIEIKPMAIPEKTFSEDIALIERKEAFGGKKITLIIPEEDKAAVRSNVKVVRFVQKVGEYNRTGEWEPEKKNKIGELWAKFLESTKTNEKSKL